MRATIRLRPMASKAPPKALPPSSLLQLMWLASPALLVGGFSYSEGLEIAVDRAQVATESEAIDWLIDHLHMTLARSDLAVLAKAVGAWRRADMAHVNELNEWVLQTRELRLQTEQMGRSLLVWLRNHDTVTPAQLRACGSLAPTYPIAFALAASSTQANVRDCLLAYAFGWAENMAQAAIKAIPLGQSAGQRILSRLSADIPAAVDPPWR